MPALKPVVPEEAPTESQLVSRDDPLADMLEQTALDAVLGRYGLHGRSGRPVGCRLAPVVAAMASIAAEREDEEETEATSPLFQAASQNSSQVLPSQPSAMTTSSAASGKPRGTARRQPLSAHAHATLQRTRGLAEPLGQRPNAPERPTARVSGLATVSERAAADHLE